MGTVNALPEPPIQQALTAKGDKIHYVWGKWLFLFREKMNTAATLPIAQADVTNLVTDLTEIRRAAKVYAARH